MQEINLTAPHSWEELSARQLKYVSWLMTTGRLSPAELQTYAFVRFTGIRVMHEKDGYLLCEYKKRLFTLSPEQILSFSGKMAWLTSGIGEIVPLPEMAGRMHVDARLRGTPLKQYLACENYYQAYIFTGNIDFLRRLAACFYTSKEEFNDAETSARAEDFLKIPFHVLHTVFLWYYGLKSVLHKNFPHFFRKSESILEDDNPQAPDMRKQTDAMIRALTGGDVTKTGAVSETETWTALAELDAKALEYKEMEARIKKPGIYGF